MTTRPNMEAELILYAVPTGPLAETIDSFFGMVSERPTKAQAYPPHCTLTGFFHDDTESTARYVAAAAGVVRPIGVDVWLRTTPEWIGLELTSPDLQRISRDFAAAVASTGTRRTTIRVKDWLHVSLAYGYDPSSTTDLTQVAMKVVDPSAAVDWDLRLYERRSDVWIVHGSWPLPRQASDSTDRHGPPSDGVRRHAGRVAE